MALFDIIVRIVEQAWQLSVHTLPALFLLSFIWYFATRGDNASALELAISSQREPTLAYGLYLVAGAVIGGILQLLIPALSLVVGSLAVGIAAVYAYRADGAPALTPLTFDGWQSYKILVWTLVPVLAAAALLLQDPLLKSIVALAFYTAIFWKL